MSAPPEHVVVAGGGIGGLSCAFDLRSLLPQDVRISVISDRPSFQFTPSNPWVALGSRTADAISVPMREACEAGGVDYVNARLCLVDPDRKQIELENAGETTTVAYDYLVAATGARLDWNGLISLEHGAHSETSAKISAISICSTPHAELAAEACERFLRAGGGPVVVGAIAGASCFGPAYEFALALEHELRAKGVRANCPMTFVTPEPYAGHMGLAGVGRSYEVLSARLEEKGITLLANCAVERVDTATGTVVVRQSLLDEGEAEAHAAAGEDVFEWSHTERKREIELPASLLMLIPQFNGQECWTRSGAGLANEQGLIIVDEWMRNPTHKDVYGVGVCVALKPVEATPIPTGPPKTGYMIESMGTAVAHNIRESIRARRAAGSTTAAPDETRFRRPSLDTLCLTDFGGSDGAAFVASPEMPPRRVSMTVTGGIAKLAKVAFESYFLFKVRTGNTDPFYEKYLLRLIGIDRLEHDS
jgi:sulfide:quinone oxidoreductase